MDLLLAESIEADDGGAECDQPSNSVVNPVFVAPDDFENAPTDNRAEGTHDDEVQNEEYEVESILDHEPPPRSSAIPKKFFIKWKGFSESYNTWEPIENLICPSLLQDYLRKHGFRMQPARKATKSPDTSVQKTGSVTRKLSTGKQNGKPNGTTKKKQSALNNITSSKQENIKLLDSGTDAAPTVEQIVLLEFLQTSTNDNNQTDSGRSSGYELPFPVVVPQEDGIGTESFELREIGDEPTEGFDGLAGTLETVFDGKFSVVYDTSNPDMYTLLPFDEPIPWKGTMFVNEIAHEQST